MHFSRIGARPGAPAASAGVRAPAPWIPPRTTPADFLSPSPPTDDDGGARQSVRANSQRGKRPQRCHVLLIEDDPAAANALRVILTMRGCEVALATSLEAGLDLLRMNPTAIVTDLMLPDGDGIEILTRVREAKLPIKVAVATSVSDPARLAAVHRLKPDAILHKPFDVGELLRAIGVG